MKSLLHRTDSTVPERHRHLAALPRGDSRVFLSWRLLSSDAPREPFHVERGRGGSWERATSSPITDSTNLLDTTPDLDSYDYRVVDSSGDTSESVTVNSGADPSVAVLDCEIELGESWPSLIVGDLQNTGRMGAIIRTAFEGNIHFIAYDQDENRLWKFDTKLPSKGGWDGSMQHAPFLCWDINGDGRTEFVTHAYDGAYPKVDYDTALDGELLIALDAETGDVVWKTAWPAMKSRVMMTVGHIRGIDKPPAVVVQDETYGDIVLTAIDGKSADLLWRIEQPRAGGHNLDIADIDGDGVQEVIAGGICYNGNGTIRWEAEPFGHTDISKPARIVPGMEGMQICYAVENPKEQTGVYLLDNKGKTLWKEFFHHAHYGWIARHAPGVDGLHPHVAEDGRRETRDHFPIFLPDGSTWLNLSDWQRKNFVPVSWDERPEVVFVLRKENKRIVRLLESGELEELPGSKLPEGGKYERNLGCVDVVGDFRENIVALDIERNRLMILMNPTVATRRGYSPMDDFEYRHDRSQLGSGYYIYLSPPVTTV